MSSRLVPHNRCAPASLPLC
ncbi:hypothetical protein M3J09_013586 [Ascochyta lentis]